jgi:hypothetical protein
MGMGVTMASRPCWAVMSSSTDRRPWRRGANRFDPKGSSRKPSLPEPKIALRTDEIRSVEGRG